MKRRSFIAGLSATLTAPLIWLGFKEPEPPEPSLVYHCTKCGAQYDPISEHEKWRAHERRCGLNTKYVRACDEAGVPEDEIGKVVVAEVCHQLDWDLGCPVWRARRFEQLRGGDIFRGLYPDSTSWLVDPGIYRADTNAQLDPSNPINAGLTGVRISPLQMPAIWSRDSRESA